MDSDEQDEERFVALFTQYERQLRAFVRGSGLDWNAVDDVMQTVSLVMWRKWNEFDPSTDFLKWGRVIARFEILKYRRRMARDRHVFSEELMSQLAEEWDDSASDTEKYEKALERCLDSLPERSHLYIRQVYGDDRLIKDVAREAGKSATAFYKILDRIRQKLQICIEERMAEA